eukprot:6209520-Pleurochrysis_carterae.AAC.2
MDESRSTMFRRCRTYQPVGGECGVRGEHLFAAEPVPRPDAPTHPQLGLHLRHDGGGARPLCGLKKGGEREGGEITRGGERRRERGSERSKGRVEWSEA